MTQANLQAYALSQGITKQVSAMTQAEQVQLRYNYVMAQTVKAQGDFARTGNSFANQGRKLTETLKQAGEGFGEQLLPIVTEAISKVQEGVEWIAQLDDSTKNIILSTGMVIAAVGPLLIAGSKVLSLVSTLKTAMAALSLNPVALGITAVAAAGVAIAGLSNKMNDASREIDTTSERYQHLKDKFASGFKAEADFDMTDGSQAEMETFEDLLAQLPKDETYEAEGKFLITGASEEVINAYAEALALAAGATSGYADAVERLNSVIDRAATEQIERLTADLVEEQEAVAIAFNAGAISEEDRNERLRQLTEEFQINAAAVQEAADAGKEYNRMLADGNAANDADVVGDTLSWMTEGKKLTEEHFNDALSKLAGMREDGEGMTGGAVEGAIVNTYLLDEAISKYEGLARAVESYQSKVSNADAQQTKAQAYADELAATAEAVNYYYESLALGASAEVAFQDTLEQFGEQINQYSGLREKIESELQPSEGQYLGVNAAAESVTDLEAFASEAAATAEQIAQTAQSARETAASELQATAASLAEGTSSAQLEGILQLTESAGAAISEADQQAIIGAQQIVEDLSSTLAGGSESVEAALQMTLSGLESATGSAQQDGAAAGESFISGAVGSINSGADNVQHAAEQAVDGLSSAGSGAYSDGKSIGSDLMSGVSAGISAGLGKAMASAMSAAQSVVNAFKSQAEIESPSKVMRDEVGVMLMRGVSVGVQKETPEVVKIMRESTQNILSGGTQVVDRGAYTVPAMQSAGAFGIDYDLMGEKLTDAVGALRIGIDMDGHEVARNMREDNARQLATRTHEINMGKGRT
jgi:hypothetical protein